MSMLGIRLQVRDVVAAAAAAAALPARLSRVELGLVALAVVHGIGGNCQLFFYIRGSLVVMSDRRKNDLESFIAYPTG